MDLSIIIVCTNEFDYLKACINSIYKLTDNVEYEIIVINNNCPDAGIGNFLKENIKKFNHFKIIENNSTLSFTQSNNLGLSKASGEFIIFLNPDTILLNNAFKILTDFLSENKKVGVCGSRLFDQDKTYQVSFYSFPTVFKTFLKVIGVNKFLSKYPFILKFLSNFKRIMPEYAYLFNLNFDDLRSPIEVPWVTSACLIVRRDIIKKIGKFDENIKIYADDMDFCLRIRDEGYKIYFVPEAKLIHYRGWGKKSARSISLYFNGHRYYYMKHFRGINRILLIILNNIEWSCEKVFLFFRIHFKK